MIMPHETAVGIGTDAGVGVNGADLNERLLRRDEFRPDVEVTLAGKSWWLPRPRIRMVRQTLPDGGKRLVSQAVLAEHYGPLLETFEDAIESGDNLMLAMFDLAEGLLKFNYDLTPTQVDSLLSYDAADPANVELWKTILDTARGFAPKPEGSGDDPA